MLDVGGARVGDLICFEVVYDGLVHDVVDGGAGMLVVQTNNATFGYTDESEQQLAMSRLRAVEFGRTVAVAATSGISAIVAPDGTVVRSSSLFTPAVFVEEIAQRDSVTVAQRLGAAPEWALTALGRRCACSRPLLPRLRGRRRGDERPRPGDRPDVQRGREPRARSSTGCTPACPAAHALVVDDGSPDGTGELAEQARGGGRARARAAPARQGRAGAGLRGGVPLGPRARLRRRRRDGRRRLARARAAAPAAGRPGRRPTWCSARGTCPAARVTDWPAHRLLLSRVGNRYTRWALRLPLTDATGGYRAARGELIDRLHFDDVASEGYCFQVDWAWRAVRAGARVTEVPITFAERQFGRSKMSGSIVREALVRVTVWGLQDRLADWLPGRVSPSRTGTDPRRRAVSAAR